MTTMLRLQLVAFLLLLPIAGCGRSDPSAELATTLQALTEQLAQQQAMLQDLRPPGDGAGWNGPAAPPLPSGPPTGGAPTGPPTGAPPGGLPLGPAPTDFAAGPGPGGVPGEMPPPPGPPSIETAFFSATAESATSAIPSFGPPTLQESVWSGSPMRFPFLAQRELPESTMLVFREDDLTVVGPDHTLSLRVDYRPTAMVCRQLWPCVVVIDEDAIVHPIWYEVVGAEEPGEPATLFVLDCLTRDRIEGGAEFPTNEALLENGGLVARHRTNDLLCVRRLSDAGLRQVRIEGGAPPP